MMKLVVTVIEDGKVLSMEAIETAVYQTVIDYCHGNRTEAADLLGIGRSTLYRRLGRPPHPYQRAKQPRLSDAEPFEFSRGKPWITGKRR